MDLLIFLLILLVCSAIVLIIDYYRRLFSDGREQYERGEILDIREIVWEGFKNITSADNSSGYAGLSIGIIGGLLTSYMGGMYGAHYESYLFHSALLPALWLFGLPFLKEQLTDPSNGANFFERLVIHDRPFFFGFSMAVMAQNFAVYGLHHAISFLWIIINNLLIAGMVIYRFMKTESGSELDLYRDDDEKESDDEE